MGELDAYVLEVVQTNSAGQEIRQIQYIIWIDKDFALAVVGSTPTSSWTKYEKAIKASIESVKMEKIAISPTQSPLQPPSTTGY